jgi:hypothetical protein
VNLIIATGQNDLAMNRTILDIAREFVDGPELTDGMLNRIEAGHPRLRPVPVVLDPRARADAAVPAHDLGFGEMMSPSTSTAVDESVTLITHLVTTP